VVASGKSLAAGGVLALMIIGESLPATAQQGEVSGTVASSSVGRVGQRQGRDQAATTATPLARLSNRIDNRINSRINNRLDRNYTPQRDTTAAITRAQRSVRQEGGTTPR
jgi:hypothetical protein